MHMNPYLFFSGNCEAAFKFYAQCLGGKIEMMLPHAGSPAETQVPPDWRDKIMHVRMSVGDQLLMGSDATPGHQDAPKGFYVSLQIEDPAEAERIFDALATNGQVRMALAQTFWARRFGMLMDQFGTPWMINCQ